MGLAGNPINEETPDAALLAAESLQSIEPGVFQLPKGVCLDTPVKNSPEICFWKKYLKDHDVKKIVAPMVDQSELAFRMFLRDRGADLTFTPMIHAHLFVNDPTYRRNSLKFCDKDRPLIVQFCANKPDTFLAACRLVEGYCDGVDLNLGCPQNVAKRGHYGSYLQEEVDLVCEMVSLVRDYCKLPISCKIRIKDCKEATKEYATRIVSAGASMLTVHGRTREMKGPNTGIADWSRIKEVVNLVDVPVIANGNIQMPGDVERCIESTGAVAVMSAEGILYNPMLFARENNHRESWEVAIEYLDYAKRFGAGISAVRAHVFRILHHSLLQYDDLRMRVSVQHRIEDFVAVAEEVRSRVQILANSEEGKNMESEARILFDKIRNGAAMDPLAVTQTPHWISKPYFRLSEEDKQSISGGNKILKEKIKMEIEEIAKQCGISIKHAKKREKRKLSGQKTALIAKKMSYPPCLRCKQPGGQGCHQTMCKKCCKFTCKFQKLDCNAHRAKFSHLNEVDEVS